ncbi:MAG: DUF1080 domain-containing protein [Planctomycetota bacterium]|nr:MAG: DUF1080 domain-containing protein [Planctomycetota bacterium]REJ95681.1 MAG: DUF1080 domain-containing protein [Planctomycetota bacterium]REK29193.1 MAG: DUF1080 domain-containing protein [Planctomycetota bacterium]REK46982.1 MAG: DUF1080 domain-containing protein [Planctomycetota bacterium]
MGWLRWSCCAVAVALGAVPTTWTAVDVTADDGEAAADVAPIAADAGEWISLFNGRDLTGWTPKITGFDLGENVGDTFRVEDGVLKVAYDQYEKFDGRFGHLFYETPYSHYVLRAEYRFVGEQCPEGPAWAWRNSGFMLHGEDPAQMTRDQKFPDSIEVQLLGGRPEGDRPTANLCTPGTDVVMDEKLLKQHCLNSESETFRGDEWVTIEIEVRGGESIEHRVNGETVMRYTRPQLDDGTLLTSGTISLQSESHPIEFRKIELRVLPH